MSVPSVVLDTNVLISAHLSPMGLEYRVYRYAIEGQLRLFVSPAILAEYEDVLRRPKFRFPRANITRSVAQIKQNSTLVVPGRKLAVSRDERDNRFLECAEAANAEFLVTGNRRHFPEVWKTTRIVSARELIGAVFKV